MRTPLNRTPVRCCCYDVPARKKPSIRNPTTVFHHSLHSGGRFAECCATLKLLNVPTFAGGMRTTVERIACKSLVVYPPPATAPASSHRHISTPGVHIGHNGVWPWRVAMKYCICGKSGRNRRLD
ncbi:hypothetical protein ZHAS_00005982 [Anopheles sinensis]|uniref:Uncharacterized protein n=1 Tax=Anopheles sinensis TaxID=74873 RepID=A0A084VKW1_ANOSI|nr:hypothetical protein ZHAS_00005982 [Anopheles sinensis]